MWLRTAVIGLAIVATARAAERAAAPATVSGPPEGYTIGVEDALRIAVWGEKDLNMTVRVRPDGKISVPLVNEIDAAGMSPEALRQELTTRLSKFIRDPNVTVIVEEINSYRVYVIGEVRTQGVLQFRRPTRLLQALAAAGGLTEFSKKEIVIIREEDGVERRIRVDYKKLLSGEGSAENVVLRPGDTILVS